MADNNIKNKSQKDLLGEIANNTSVFGKKIKIPSKSGNEREEEVNLMEVVLRGISSALFGRYVKDPNQIESIFKNPKNSIFGRTYVNINNIAKAVTKTADGAALRITNPSLDKLDNINDTLNEIKDMLGDNKSSNINKVVSSSDYANNAVQSLKDLLSIVKDDKFKELEKIISKPAFKNLLKSINDNLSGQLDKNVVNNVNIISKIIQTLSEISKINLNELKKSERTLDFVNKGYINKIHETLEKIDTLYKTTNDIDISDHLSALRDIIDTIPSIASLSLKDILWSRISINYLNDFIKDKIPSIITTLNDVLKNNSDLGDKTEKLDKCINSILSIFKLNPKDLEDNEETIELINSLIKNDISKLIETINTNFDNLDDIIIRINNITTLINSIDDMQKMLPSIMSIFKSIIKLSFIQEEIDTISVILFPNELQEKYKIHIFKAKRNHFKEISKNLENFGEILKTLNKVNEDIRTIKIGDILKILTNVNTELVIVNKLFNKLTKLDKKYKTPLTFEGLQQTLNAFNDYVMSDIEDKLSDNIVAKIDSITSFVDAVNSLIVILNNLDIELLESIDMSKFSGAIESKLRVLMTTVDYIKNDVDINEDIIKKIDILDKVITKIALLSNLKLLETISEKSLDGLIGVTDKFVEITNKFKQIKEDDVKGANKMLNSLMKLVIGTTTVLLFGTLMMSFINPLSLISFTVSLGAFIFGILWVYSKISKDQLESSFSSAKDLGLLIALSGAVLVFGSLFMRFVNITELFGFAAVLGLFISGILWVYSIFSKNLKETFTSAYDLGLLIAISGGTLILGSLFYHFINWDDLVGFSLTLGAFIFGILGIYAFLNKWFGNAMKGAKEFSTLLGVSAGLLILGALIGNWLWENWKPIVKFGIMLFAFVSIFGAVWCGLSWMFNKALKGAKEFAILITVSAAAMLLGPALINLYGGELGSNYWERLGAIAVWGIALGGFVLLVGWALSLANKNGKSSILGALALSVAIGVAAAALIAGPKLLYESIGNDWWMHVLGFAVILAGFIFGMTYLLKFVGKKIGDLALGAVGVVIIGAIAYGAAWVVKEISDMLFDVHWEDLLNGLGQMGLVFGAVGTVMGIIGGIVYGTGGVALLIAAGGAAVLATLEGLVWGAAKVINAIANSMMNLDKAAKIFKDGNNVQSMMEMINAFGNVLKLLCDKISLKMAAKLTTIMPGVIMGISALSMIGNVVKDWANMWVPDIDPKTGKKKGYRKLTDTEISTAITNIGNVITAIGTAIRNVIDDPKNKDMFAEGFLSGKSPFRVVMESFKYSGDVLSSIAEGVKQWSSMAIPNGFDDKGKPKGYISLNDTVLTHTQKNIENVLTAIGKAIVNTVNGKDAIYFAMGENSPVIIAAKSINETSQALNNIVQIIKDFSNEDFQKIVQNINVKGGTIDTIKGILGGLLDILNIFLNKAEGTDKGFWGTITGGKTVAEHLNDNKDEIEKTAETIKTFTGTIKSIFESVGKLCKDIKDDIPNLKIITEGIGIQILKKGLTNLLGIVNGVLIENENILDFLNDNKEKFNVFISFNKILDDFINSIIKYDSTAQTNLIMLTEGMINLYMTTQFINKNLFFKEFVNDTERFIHAINTLDLSKISSLSQLTQALNEIASKFGNLDELTDALANKVTVVLLELVNQLRTAETVIRNAHELQERRKKLIESNIKKVKEIMSQHMIVEIGKKEESEQLSSGAPGTIKYPGETNTGGGGRDTTAELESPETPNQGAGDAEKEKVKNGVGSAKPLTADEFVNLMKKHMSDSIWTS